MPKLNEQAKGRNTEIATEEFNKSGPVFSAELRRNAPGWLRGKALDDWISGKLQDRQVVDEVLGEALKKFEMQEDGAGRTVHQL